MKEILTDSAKLIKKELSSIIIFELIYKLLGILVILPVINCFIQFAMQKAGITYITTQNLTTLLQHPLCIITFIAIILIIALYLYIEIIILITIFDKSYHNEKVSFKNIVKESLLKVFAIFYPKNMILLLFVVIILPTIYITLISGLTKGIQIPEFLMEYITNSPLEFTVFIIVVVSFILLTIRWMFSFHYMILGKGQITFKSARRNSIAQLNKKRLQNIFVIILWFIIVTIIMFMVYVILLMIAFITIKLVYSGNLYIKDIFWNWYENINSFILIIGNIIALSGMWGLLSVMFYQHRDKHNFIIEGEMKKKNIRDYIKILISISIILLLLTQYSVLSKYGMSSVKDSIQPDRIKITAHRGDSSSAPENTLSAIKEAVNKNVDFAEIDVQQTKDGELILLHDTNLKRITGLNKQIWDVNYEEIKSLDAGSWFSNKYKGEHLAKLEDVLQYAKGKIKLNIEIKKQKHREDLEQKIIDLIKKYHFEKDCVISSFKYDILRKVKELAPDIKTVYLVAIGYGEFYKLPGIDAYSVEVSSISYKLVNEIHERGKEIYAWTVNSKENMRKVIDMGVDNIITGHIAQVRNLIKNGDNHIISNIVNKYLI